MRSPDIAYVRAERIPVGGVRTFFQGAPDLPVEVISPSDRASEVISKARNWLQRGCHAVWVIDPETRTATVYSSGPQTLFLSARDALVCEELLPGFRLPISQVFDRSA
jgi:Uma2 family endonuclease